MLFLRREKYQYIHFNWSLIPQIDRFVLPFLYREKLIYSMHNLVPHGQDQKKRVAEHDLAKKSKKVVILSGHIAERARMLNTETHLMQHGLTIKPRRSLSRNISKCYFVGNVKPYKGISSFIDLAQRGANEYKFHIFGKWDASMIKEKVRARKVCNIEDAFLPEAKFNSLFLEGESIFILPYSDITQSGIMYNVISGCAPFIASDRGEFSVLARKIGYRHLLFEPSDIDDMERALLFCAAHAHDIKRALERVQGDYAWSYGQAKIGELYGS